VALGSVIRSLAGDRVVYDDRVGHPEYGCTRGKVGDRMPDRRHEPAGEDTVRIGERDIASPLRFPRQKLLEKLAGPVQVLFWVTDIVPAVHRPAGDAFEDHDLAAAAHRQRREDEVLADAGYQVEADRRILWTRLEPGDVGERERALRRVIRRFLRVSAEEIPDRATPGRNDDEVVIAGESLQLLDSGFANEKLAVPAGELLHPGRDLQPLVDRLG